jgi:hypothetical protein
MVLDVVQHEVARHGVEAAGQLRMRLAQVAHAIGDLVGRGFRRGQLDQPGREVDAGHPGATGGQDA